MRSAILVVIVAGALAGCGRNSNEGSSGNGKIYGRGGEDQPAKAPAEVRAGASSTATDLRPTGGSMAGAGGAGPGYDGSGHGSGRNGTIPAPGAGFGGSLTNAEDTTHPAGDATWASQGNRAQRPASETRAQAPQAGEDSKLHAQGAQVGGEAAPSPNATLSNANPPAVSPTNSTPNTPEPPSNEGAKAPPGQTQSR